jgi:hypothetical protein
MVLGRMPVMFCRVLVMFRCFMMVLGRLLGHNWPPCSVLDRAGCTLVLSCYSGMTTM